jgi:hypothetical protein
VGYCGHTTGISPHFKNDRGGDVTICTPCVEAITKEVRDENAALRVDVTNLEELVELLMDVTPSTRGLVVDFRAAASKRRAKCA